MCICKELNYKELAQMVMEPENPQYLKSAPGDLGGSIHSSQSESKGLRTRKANDVNSSLNVDKLKTKEEPMF